MTRETAMTLMRIAGYHNDGRERVRLLVESRVSRRELDRAWREGGQAKQKGVACRCFDCQKERTHGT